MKQLENHIKTRNSLLDNSLIPLNQDLQNCFNRNILRAGVAQPGYFSDFYPILENYKIQKVIQKYMVTEEEHTENGVFYKIPVIDVQTDSHISYRIFLSPF